MDSFLLPLLTLLLVLQGGVLVFLFFRLRGGSQSADSTWSREIQGLSTQSERIEKNLRDELARNREEMGRNSKDLREEVAGSVRAHAETGAKQVEILTQMLKTQLQEFTQAQSTLTLAIEGKLNQIQDSNTRKLEEMRQTVDEKLQGTLEKRLGESFKQVSDRLEMVHKGLGEMQSLATGVGDLKRVLTNVKTRGTWGEIQLRAILEQILLPSQFEANVKVRPDSADNVEFAVKLPGGSSDDQPVWLPIDSKFPKEDYERILDCQDRADAEGLKSARESLARSLRGFAKDIRQLYVAPPFSTDFAILFVPTEGLFAEICQQPGLLDNLQRDFRVTVAGPTTMATLLNSLQMGFQTLAIQKRSSEVWQVLGAVKTEFGKFGDLLGGVEKKLEEARNKIASVRSKTTTISRRLKQVEELPHDQALSGLLGVNDEEPSPALVTSLDDSTETITEEQP